MEQRREFRSADGERHDREELPAEPHAEKREELPSEAKDQSRQDDRRESEARTGAEAEDAAEQCRAVMLERVVVVEPLVGQPIVDRRQLRSGEIVRDEMKIGKAVVVLDDLRKRQSPHSAIEQRTQKDDLARPECLVGKSRPLAPNHEQRQRRQRQEERVETAEPDEMLEREKSEANGDDACRARRRRKRNVANNEQRQRRGRKSLRSSPAPILGAHGRFE
jgi:hypothetical protein